MSKKKTVIYARLSSDMQRAESCEDQEREVRLGLEDRGIHARDALVLFDRAESGTKADRTEFGRLRSMVFRGEVGILAVDYQARLNRSGDAFNFINDLVYHGGRFISTGEGIDTLQDGWELRVKVVPLLNSTTISDLGRRVHRGQKGRVLAEGSTGDFPFGFESYYLDPNWIETVLRVPRPKKGLRILEAEARWVRQVFAWFADEGRGIAEIARELTRLGVSKGTTSSKAGWHHAQVRGMLANPKYIGRWVWGATKTICNSVGKTKKVPVPEKDWVIQDRPNLRIIDQQTWDRARRKLEELDQIYGQKEYQKPRGAKHHHTEIYPKTLLGGLIFCRACGKRLWIRGSDLRARYLNCQNHIQGSCAMAGHVPVDRAEKALLEFVSNLLSAWPDWLETASEAMRATIEEPAGQLPAALREDEDRLVAIERRVDNLVDHLADGAADSPALRRRLQTLEHEPEVLRDRVEEGQSTLKATVTMPDDRWIRERMSELPRLLSDDPRRAAPLLCRLLGRVEAESIVAPGKERGFIRLHLRLEALSVLQEALGGRLPETVLALATQVSGIDPQAFEIDLGAPNRRDISAPKIDEMRRNGVIWKEIGEITGLGTGNTHNVWKRWKDAQPSVVMATN